MWLELSDEAKFAMSSDEIPLNTVFFMTGRDISHILAYLNSKVVLWYFTKCLGCSSGVGTNRWLKFTIEQLPIPLPSNTGIDLSKESTLCPNLEIEHQIDKLTAKSYELSDAEFIFIDSL